MSKEALLLKYLIFLGISAGLLFILWLNKSSNRGDGTEYTLILEAIYNHLSPDLHQEDIENFKKNVVQYQTWESIENHEFFEKLSAFIASKPTYMNNMVGFFADYHSRLYSYHFWFYSLTNIPAKMLLHMLGINPLNAFLFTNILFVMVTCAIILFTAQSDMTSGLFCLIFLFSPVIWYLNWPHPEVYTACLTFLGAWYYYQQKPYLALFAIAMAALQNQPLVLLFGFIALDRLVRSRFYAKEIVVAVLLGTICLIPDLFYYSHYGHSNLVSATGFLSTHFITWSRISGFFFDLNQGMILSLPLILPLSLLLLCNNILYAVQKRVPFDSRVLLSMTVIPIAVVVSTAINWNHGQAVINRYATWVGMIILASFFSLVQNSKSKNLMLLSALFSQIYVIFLFGGINVPSWDHLTYKAPARWVTEHYPSLYNPDPYIFSYRTIHRPPTPLESPIVYLDKTGKARKIMIHRDDVKNFYVKNIGNEKLQKKIAGLYYINDWAYINDREICSRYDPVEADNIRYEKQIAYYVNAIRKNENLLKQTEEKAKTQHRPFEEMLRLEAANMVETSKSR